MALTKETRDGTDINPSIVIYQQLIHAKMDTLDCPCADVSVKYKSFININTSFHQVCSSDFIGKKWIRYLYGSGITKYHERSDIRVRGSGYFDYISMLCSISQKNIETTITRFLDTSSINNQIMPKTQFDDQMKLVFQQLVASTSKGFSRELQLVHQISERNSFVSSYFLNWKWLPDDTDSYKLITPIPITLNGGCSCAIRSDCSEEGGIYRSFSGEKIFTMPGLRVACSVVETVLQTTLECLYNQTCVDTLQFYAATVSVSLNNYTNVTAMDSKLRSRFQMNSTIRDLVDEQFIEEWYTDASYQTFYEKCLPSFCSYTWKAYPSFLFILSKGLGLYGGSTVALKFCVPYSILLYNIVKNRFFKNTVAPSS